MFKQLFSKYGKDSGSIILGQFNTNIVFRNNDIDEATMISKRASEIEYLAQAKNTSYGAHEHRDGISYSEQEKKKAVIKASDITNLATLEAFLLLPFNEAAVVKTMTNIVQEPQNTQQFFISNSNIYKD